MRIGLQIALAALLAIATVAAFPAQGAERQNRIALVIGNKDYPQRPLANSENDAVDMAEALSGLGFKTLLHRNVDAASFRRAIRQFEDALADAGRGASAVFFFAGHGVQIGGRNYLLPTGVAYQDHRDVIDFAIDADQVLSRLQDLRPDVTIFVLDACRDDPLPARLRANTSSGLARMDAPAGVLIAFATSPGKTASDNPGDRNGLFTKHLLTHVKTPGLTAEQVFRRVRTDVYRASRGAQLPEDSNRLVGGDFFFASPLASTAVAPSSSDAPAVGSPRRAAAPAGTEPDNARVGLARSEPSANQQKSEQTRIEQDAERLRTDLARVDQAKVDQARIEQARIDQAKAEQARVEQARLDQAKAEQARVERARLDQVKAEQARVEQARIDQAKAEQARVEKARIDQARAEPTRVEQARRPVDTAIALAALSPPGNPSSAAPTPSERLAGLLATGKGVLAYRLNDAELREQREMTLTNTSTESGRFEFSDRTVYRNLREMVEGHELVFQPPIPLAVQDMAQGKKWKHSGKAIRRDGLAEARISSEFTVQSRERRTTPAGDFDTFKVQEDRYIQSAHYRFTRWIDASTLAMVSETAATVVSGSRPINPGLGYFDPFNLNYSMDLIRIR